MDSFQNQAMKSVAVRGKGVDALAHRSLGLAGEAGEAANRVKKIIRDHGGKPTPGDVNYIKEKLGDNLYYLAVLSEYFGLKLSDIAESNLQKSAEFKKARKLQQS